MAAYQVISFDQPFPANTFSNWITNKYTVIALILLLLLVVGVALYLKNRKEEENNKSITKKLSAY